MFARSGAMCGNWPGNATSAHGIDASIRHATVDHAALPADIARIMEIP
jgi:hypothetical protein